MLRQEKDTRTPNQEYRVRPSRRSTASDDWPHVRYHRGQWGFAPHGGPAGWMEGTALDTTSRWLHEGRSLQQIGTTGSHCCTDIYFATRLSPFGCGNSAMRSC